MTQTLKSNEDLDKIQRIRSEVNRLFDEIIEIGQTEIPEKPDAETSTLQQVESHYKLVKPLCEKLNSKVYSLAIEVNSARGFLLKHTSVTEEEIIKKKQSWHKH